MATGEEQLATGRGASVMPNLLDGARVHATEGAIAGTLQSVPSSSAETPVF
jgi:hypothetical protein